MATAATKRLRAESKRPMAHTTDRALLFFLGFVEWGDLGILTIYRNRKGKMVAFSKTWPDKPASPLQVIQRQRMSDAAIAWQALTPGDRREWETASIKAGLCATGYNIFVHWQMLGDDSFIKTLERQTGTTLRP